MYRFTVARNKADHKPFVVLFGLFACCFSLFLTTLTVQLLTLAMAFISGRWCWLQFKAVHSDEGVVILSSSNICFESKTVKINGNLSCKSRVYPKSVWLHIESLAQSRWLIVNARSVEPQNFIRLKRAILAARTESAGLK